MQLLLMARSHFARIFFELALLLSDPAGSSKAKCNRRRHAAAGDAVGGLDARTVAGSAGLGLWFLVTVRSLVRVRSLALLQDRHWRNLADVRPEPS